MSKEKMLRDLRSRGIENEQVLQVMDEIDRADFLEEKSKTLAYLDQPISIGCGQTISQPFMVAEILQELQLSGREKVLEIGTGSGYSTALTSRIAREVWTVEKEDNLWEKAKKRLAKYRNVHVLLGDGSLGWQKYAPYDRIAIHAATPPDTRHLLEQLAPGGMLLAPIKDGSEEMLTRITIGIEGQEIREKLLSCFFVPLIGDRGF